MGGNVFWSTKYTSWTCEVYAKWVDFVVAHFDDTIVHSKTLDEHRVRRLKMRICVYLNEILIWKNSSNFEDWLDITENDSQRKEPQEKRNGVGQMKNKKHLRTSKANIDKEEYWRYSTSKSQLYIQTHRIMSANETIKEDLSFHWKARLILCAHQGLDLTA